MMNKRFLYLWCAVGSLLSGCEKHELPLVNERTIIVYINADNNLYDITLGDAHYGALMDINEMELGWDNEQYRKATLLVYLNSKSRSKEPPKIYRITHDEQMPIKVNGKLDDGIRSPIIHTYTDHDSSDPKILSQVLNDAMMIAPAKSYGLVFWSHGTGWVPMNMGQPLKSSGSGEAIANYTFGASDSYQKSQMEIPDLAKALPSNVVFDYIAFDACYMGCIEVAYELRNHCRRFIGSAVETPVDGFEYHEIMAELVSGDAEGWVQKHYDNYKKRSGWWATCALSSIDCSKLEALAAANKQLIENNPRAIGQLTTSGVEDLGSSSSFRGTYYDFEDFMAKNWSTSGADWSAFQTAFTAAVKIKHHLPGNLGQYTIKTYSGFSCYAPKASQPKALAAYREKFAWSTASGMGAIE